MEKIDWVRKLTSRKFWLAIAGFAVGLLIYFGKTPEEANQIEGLIMAGATALAYIIGEGLRDAAEAKAPVYYVDEEYEEPPEVEQ